MVCCDQCEVWYHTTCIGMQDEVYAELTAEGCDREWFCHQCAADDEHGGGAPEQSPSLTAANFRSMLGAKVRVQWSVSEAYDGVIDDLGQRGSVVEERVHVAYEDGDSHWEPVPDDDGKITILAPPPTPARPQLQQEAEEQVSVSDERGSSGESRGRGGRVASERDQAPDRHLDKETKQEEASSGGGYGGAEIQAGEAICSCRAPFTSGTHCSHNPRRYHFHSRRLDSMRAACVHENDCVCVI